MNDWEHLKEFGFVAGEYMGPCLKCNNRFMGAKRCRICFDCATKEYNNSFTTALKENVVVDSSTIEKRIESLETENKQLIDVINGLTQASKMMNKELNKHNGILRNINSNWLKSL